ncbi:MAG: Uncharacterised protein [Cyanobium sp. ARS6]|nr:MAG: Uncharacterised protein [Cyanobium sp. ARS6]
MLLHQQPSIPGFKQAIHQGKQCVRVVGQVHFRQGETAHTFQSGVSEQIGELVLPGADLQSQIRNGCGGCNGMTPERAEPFHVSVHLWVAGQVIQRFGDVPPFHLRDTPEQISRIIEHDPRITALSDQLRNQISHAPVAMGEWLSVVVVPLVWMFQHVLQV